MSLFVSGYVAKLPRLKQREEKWQKKSGLSTKLKAFLSPGWEERQLMPRGSAVNLEGASLRDLGYNFQIDFGRRTLLAIRLCVPHIHGICCKANLGLEYFRAFF